jgi:hypothetical protein
MLVRFRNVSELVLKIVPVLLKIVLKWYRLGSLLEVVNVTGMSLLVL